MDGGDCSNLLCIAERYQIVFIYFKMVTMVNFMVSFSITFHVSFLCVAVNNILRKEFEGRGICFGPWFQRVRPTAAWHHVLGRVPRWWDCVVKRVYND